MTQQETLHRTVTRDPISGRFQSIQKSNPDMLPLDLDWTQKLGKPDPLANRPYFHTERPDTAYTPPRLAPVLRPSFVTAHDDTGNLLALAIVAFALSFVAFLAFL